jgi:PAS domain S-box-containing protein
LPRQTARPVTRPAQLIREYLLVVTSVALATLVRYALTPFFGKRVAFITFFPALVFSAWVGGWGGGLVALALSTLAATYYFLSPAHVFTISEGADRVSLVVFIIVGLSVSAISSSQRKASRQAEEAAEDARLSEAALRESEARKTAVLEAAMDCIISADAQGHIMEFNPAAEQTFGYTRAEVLGKTIRETIIPPSLREAHQRGLDHYLATGEGPILRQRIEVIGMRKGGEEFPVEIAIVPMGEGLGYTAYLRDITARRIADALQRTFLRDVLASVTEGRLVLCEVHADLPAPLPSVGAPIPLSRESGLRDLRVRALDAADGMSDERRHDLVTAVSEAGMNAIVHGGGGVGYVGRGEDGMIQVRVEDQGAGIAVADLPRATLARGYSTKATLGHGFKMMQAVDRVYVLTGSTGSTVVLEQGGPSSLGWTFQ